MNLHRPRDVFRLTLVAALLVMGGSAVPVLTPSAAACSVIGPTTTMEFEGIATKRVKVSNSGESVGTRWTFTVKQWKKGTGGAKPLKVGSVITLDVIERAKNYDGPQSSCYDMGVVATFSKGKRYLVGASRAETGDKWFVDNYSGKLQRK